MDIPLLQHKLVQRIDVQYISTRTIDRLLITVLLIELYWILPYFVWGTGSLGQRINIGVYVVVAFLAKWAYTFAHTADDTDRQKQLIERLDHKLISLLLWLSATQLVLTPFHDRIDWTPTSLMLLQTCLWFTASSLTWNTHTEEVKVISHERIVEP